MTEIGLFSTNLSNTAPSIGGLLQDKIEESPSYTISSHLYTTGLGSYKCTHHAPAGAFNLPDSFPCADQRGVEYQGPWDRGQPLVAGDGWRLRTCSTRGRV